MRTSLVVQQKMNRCHNGNWKYGDVVWAQSLNHRALARLWLGYPRKFWSECNNISAAILSQCENRTLLFVRFATTLRGKYQLFTKYDRLQRLLMLLTRALLGLVRPCLLLAGRSAPPPPSISVTNRSDGKIQTAIESPGRDLSDEVEKADPGVSCDVTGQVKHKMWHFHLFHRHSSEKCRE